MCPGTFGDGGGEASESRVMSVGCHERKIKLIILEF